jgi:ABC-2 type transport system permease protein
LQFIINVYIFIKQPVPQALSLAIQQREEVHCGWDRPKKETLDKFFARYPEWTDTTEIQGRFAWRWYYAFHEVGDMAVEDLAREYQQGLQARYQLVERLNVLSVPVNVQEIFNAMAVADLPAYIAFLQSAAEHHASLKVFYYPFLFRQIAFTHADYAKEPRHSFTASPDYGVVYAGLLKLLITVLLVYGLGLLIFQDDPCLGEIVL